MPHEGNIEIAQLLKNMDLYVLDQVIKGRVLRSTKILDAGCGSGRNCHFFINNGYNVTGFDPDVEAISKLRARYPASGASFHVSDIASFDAQMKFDFVICNAVLHFAESHVHFRNLMDKLSSFLSPQGILLIRMTSEFAAPLPYVVNELGRSELPDGTERYLLNRNELTAAMSRNNLYLMEPLKTVNVSNERSMSTLVLTKDEQVKLDLGWLAPEKNPMMK